MVNEALSARNTHPAVRLGTMKNYLGILSADGQKLRPKNFISATGLGAAELSKFIEKSRPQLYNDEIPLSPKLKKKLGQLVITTDMVYELLGNSIEETKKWMMLPNSVTFGDSPFEVCMRGDGGTIIEWLKERGGQL